MISKEEHEKRMELYRKGASDKEIGEALFLAQSTVFHWRKINNLPRNARHREIKPEEDALMLRLHECGMSDKKIGETVGRPTGTVRYWRVRKGLKNNFEQGGKRVK